MKTTSRRHDKASAARQLSADTPKNLVEVILQEHERHRVRQLPLAETLRHRLISRSRLTTVHTAASRALGSKISKQLGARCQDGKPCHPFLSKI